MFDRVRQSLETDPGVVFGIVFSCVADHGFQSFQGISELRVYVEFQVRADPDRERDFEKASARAVANSIDAALAAWVEFDSSDKEDTYDPATQFATELALFLRHYRNSGDDHPESRGQWVVGYGAVIFSVEKP